MKSSTSDGIGGTVFSLLSFALAAFWVMLIEGSLAGDFGWPTFSCWQSAGVVLALGAIVQYGTASLYWRGRKRATR